MTHTVGAQLQRMRHERKLSLADVTKETKIQPWVLEALEADRLQEQMSPIYAKGFLSTYARFLHLAPEPLIVQLFPPPPPAVESASQPLPPPTIHVLPALMRLRVPHAWRRRLGIAVTISVLFAGLMASHPARLLSRVPHAKAPKLASLTAMKVSEPIKPPPLQSVALLPTQSLELAVNTHHTTWMQVRADGKLLLQQRLARGASGHWTANKQFEVIVSKPSQVELTLNGQSIDALVIAHEGRLLITHRGIAKLPDDQE